jgi:hypothetical protein
MDMVQLSKGEYDHEPGLAAIGRNADSLIVTDYHALGIERIDPHVVVIGTWPGHGTLERFPTV